MAEQFTLPPKPGFEVRAEANIFHETNPPTPAKIFFTIAGPNIAVFEVKVQGEFTKNIYFDREKAYQLAEYILKHA